MRRWTRHPRCVGLARAQLRTTLADWGLTAVEDTALVVLSELLTNAVQHARVPGRQIETRFLNASGGVRIEVHDAAEERPAPRSSLEDATDGRGLAVVSALVDAWGVTGRNGVGKVVWAVLTVNSRDG
jgi:serine/threonine-protein kinase RsbW